MQLKKRDISQSLIIWTLSKKFDYLNTRCCFTDDMLLSVSEPESFTLYMNILAENLMPNLLPSIRAKKKEKVKLS